MQEEIKQTYQDLRGDPFFRNLSLEKLMDYAVQIVTTEHIEKKLKVTNTKLENLDFSLGYID